MSKIFVVMGKSSTGKDTVYKRISDDVELGLKKIVIYTTRPKREGEIDGREYFFCSDDAAMKMVEQNKVIEIRYYSTVHGTWKYFTADDGQIDIKGKDNYIIIGTLQAYDSLAAYYGSEAIVPIYLEIDDKTRIHRALEREDMQKNPKYQEMCRRYLADEKDFSRDNLMKSGVEKKYHNFNLEECVDEIKKDILAYMQG